ncbi:dynein regulatory complex subunit 3-like isoform X2 [Limulus polyphemus]|uniref:Dynein axonemal assembly factor 1 homolog n=1 Tax=Limulus polyphemus TaxID=6850 RepID=A0ABM1RXT4_LIMPO|nr:dynein regulatory complex subunit 3-like isoform X2 [Limulus polyphemus]
MNSIRSGKEPAVINELMLKTAIEKQGPQALQAKKNVEEDGIPFEHILSLQLDFKNILQIENMWQFKALKKLQLDNNIIEKIQGLEELKNLTWLDLSFNNIEHIEGLSHLSKLEDLSLYSNRITKLENLDQLSKLQVLSIGNNLIEDFENKVAASEKYGYVVEQLLAADLTKEQEKEEIRKEEEKKIVHKEAFVENLEGSQFFDSMFAEDKEGTLFTMLPGAEEYFKTYLLFLFNFYTMKFNYLNIFGICIHSE